MNLSYKKKLEDIYPTCRTILDSDTWERIQKVCTANPESETFPNSLTLQKDALRLPEFLGELARLEWSLHRMITSEFNIPEEVNHLTINPTIQLLQLSWKNLLLLLNSKGDTLLARPQPGMEIVLVWCDPKTGEVKVCAASDENLLVLKMVVEGIDPKEIAAAGDLPIGAVDAAIDRAVHEGILLKPRPRLRRDPSTFQVKNNTDDCFLSAPVFTLQWHITNACDLHCKHCYDRSKRTSLNLNRAVDILDDLHAFCHSRYVGGEVCFSGGNPFLYPNFPELYRAASERGFAIGILGNPVPREQIEKLLLIQQPIFFQVSLEGLPEHNDMIRGSGQFKRVIEFLQVLRELNVYSMVMLTLTKDNMDQVLPLAEILRGLTDSFTFNRLSMVGEGANLQLPTRNDYIAFLETYIEATESNPIMGLKDNLINILLRQNGLDLFGGCTGYGCGAAFNFISLLPDGEVHACRKFPSLIGNVLKQRIDELYESEIAHCYRGGCNACRSCDIRHVCGGCLAIAYSHSLNVFEERDPYCFMETLQ